MREYSFLGKLPLY